MINNCDIAIELDRPDGVYHPGDSISGTVYVEVNKDCRCDGLKLSREWFTHGRGNRNTGGQLTDVLFTGQWKAGERHEYPFEFQAPPGPYSYYGHYLNVDWRLDAQADIPWALDPDAQQEFQVQHAGEAERFEHGNREDIHAASGPEDDDETINWVSTIFGLILVAGGMVLSLVFWPRVAALIGLVLSGTGAWVTFKGVRNYFAEFRLGDVDVSLSSIEVEAGDTIDCEIAMRPDADVTLNEISVRIHGYERVVSGHGTDKTTYTHTLVDEATLVDGTLRQTLEGRPVEYTAEVPVPETAPPSFHAASNDVIWEMEVHIDVAGWPDWVHEQPLRIKPSAGGAAPARDHDSVEEFEESFGFGGDTTQSAAQSGPAPAGGAAEETQTEAEDDSAQEHVVEW